MLSDTRKQLLSNVATLNASGHQPTKAETLWATPKETRNGHYRILDELIADGYLTNEAEPRTPYRLQITEKGRIAIQ